MDLRELRALELAARAKITYDGAAWTVPSQKEGKYRVTLSPEATCQCEDFALRRPQQCKHIMAAKIVAEREVFGGAPAVEAVEVPKKAQSKQNWPLYNLAQQTEKDRFQELLFDLLRGIEEPPQPKTGRRRTLMKDMIFSAALKVYTTVSSRRFACDLKDSHERGYLSHLMNSMQVCHFIDAEAMTPYLFNLVEQSALPLRHVETTFAPDSSGFSTSRFVRWYDEKYGVERSGHDWVKAHAIVGTKTNVCVSVVIEDRNAGDSPQFKPLVEKAAQNFKVNEVVADKAYLSRENLELVASLGGTAYIPFKVNSTEGKTGGIWEKMFGYFQFKRDEFLKHYHQRSNVESTFSMLKAKFRDHVRAKTPTAMKNEVLLKFLCHNIVVVHEAIIELGIEADFWQTGAARTGPSVLQMRQTI